MKHTRAQNKLAYEKLIASITNPQTPNELELALNNPYSPLYQRQEKLLQEHRLDAEMIFIELCDYWDTLAKQDKQERESYVRNQIAASVLLNQKLQEATQYTAPKLEEEIKDKTLGELRTMVRELHLLLSTLHTEVAALRVDIDDLDLQVANINTNTAQLSESVLLSVKNNIIKQNILVIGVNDQPMSKEEVAAWLEKPARNPDEESAKPKTIVDIMTTLYKNDPGLLAKDIFDDQLIGLKQQSNDEFKKYAELVYHPETGFDHSSMVKFINANKLLKNIWRQAHSESFVILKGYVSELREIIPKRDQQIKRLDKTEREIQRLDTLVHQVETLIKAHEKKLSQP